MEYKALTQSTIKIVKEVTIKNAVDFSIAGMPRLGAIQYEMDYTNSGSVIPSNSFNGINYNLVPFINSTTDMYFFNTFQKTNLEVTKSEHFGKYANGSSASELCGGIATACTSATKSNTLSNTRLYSVEVDGTTYYGYKEAYYSLSGVTLSETQTCYYRIGFKGKITVILYKNATQSIDVMTKTFNGYNATDGYLCRTATSSTWYANVCLVVPKGTDDLVLGIFAEPSEA